MRLLLIALISSTLACGSHTPAAACYTCAHRSPKARAHFMKANPCPANGHRRGACPGYVVDHIVPLDCGGGDDPSNMQWQTVAAAKLKDRWELNCTGHP